MPGKVEFGAFIEKLPVKGAMHLIKVPQKVALQFSERKSVRIFCTINESVKYACALRPDGDGGFFISVGSPILKKGKFKLGQKIKAVIQKDDTEFGHEFPEELKELLAQDMEGKKYFEQLTNGAQRSLIYYINQAKSIEKRIERSLLFINRLKDTNGTWKPGKS
ncbi:MAG: DUF1905 domain-containing protein [Cyclobacteriaceae bacterium]|nr:DUF1905 domain-containing protein [Cyclobacteriaceae bacterium]